MRTMPAPGGYQPPQGQQPTGQAFGGANQAQNQLTSQQLMSTRLGQPPGTGSQPNQQLMQQAQAQQQTMGGQIPGSQPPPGGPPMQGPSQEQQRAFRQRFMGGSAPMGDMSGGYANFGGQMGGRMQGPPPGGPPMAPQGGRGSTLGQAGAVGRVANNLMGNMRGAVGNWAGGSVSNRPPQSPPPMAQPPAGGPPMAQQPAGGPPMAPQGPRQGRGPMTRPQARAGALRGAYRK